MGSKKCALKRSLDENRDTAEKVLARKQKKMEELEKDMNTLEAECIICLDVPRGKINCCQNGHILCYDCQTVMKKRNRNRFACPECKVVFTPCRNLFRRKFLSLFYKNTPLECKNDGCRVKKLMDNIGSHEEFCRNMQVDCPAKLVGGCRLSWSGSARELAKHVKIQGCMAINAHSQLLVIEDKNKISFRGEIHHEDGLASFHRSIRNIAFKSILLLNRTIYRMWTFFQIESRYFNHWILGILSSMNESALRNCKAEIIIYSNDGRRN